MSELLVRLWNYFSWFTIPGFVGFWELISVVWFILVCHGQGILWLRLIDSIPWWWCLEWWGWLWPCCAGLKQGQCVTHFCRAQWVGDLFHGKEGRTHLSPYSVLIPALFQFNDAKISAVCVGTLTYAPFLICHSSRFSTHADIFQLHQRLSLNFHFSEDT